MQVDLLALVASSGAEVRENLSLQATGEGVVELNLGSQKVGSVPRLSDADACAVCRQPADSEACRRRAAIAWRLRHVKHV